MLLSLPIITNAIKTSHSCRSADCAKFKKGQQDRDDSSFCWLCSKVPVVFLFCRPPGFHSLKKNNAVPLSKRTWLPVYWHHWGYFYWLQLVICRALRLSCLPLSLYFWSPCHASAWVKALNCKLQPLIIYSIHTHHIQIKVGLWLLVLLFIWLLDGLKDLRAE